MTRSRAPSRGWALLILLLATACEQDQPPPKPALELTGRVVDAAQLLTIAEERVLTAKLAALETHYGAQLVVATTPSLLGQEINIYSIDLARAWGLGSRDRNDGLLLLVAPSERRVRIEVGKGLERTLPDELCKHIIDEKMTPHFRTQQVARGVNDGVDALIRAIDEASGPAKAKAA